MKKATKILSFILSVLMLFSVFSAATPVFAAEVNELTSESAENEDIDVSEEIGEDTEETGQAEIISEITDMRTEYTKYFRMSDGSYMAAQYAQPVHYEENGEWKEYDYSITEKENSEKTEFVIENSDSDISFPEEFKEDGSAQIEVSARDYEIKFSPVTENRFFKKSKGEVKEYKKLKSNKIIEEFTQEASVDESADKNSEKLKIDNQKSAIAYKEIYNDVDLEYEISSNQIKESIVLNSKQEKNKFEFVVDTDGLFPKKEADGSITLYADKECTEAVSSIVAPYMYDAGGEYSYDVEMDIKDKNGVYILTVKASNNWLNDNEREYPVVIDPTIILDVGRAKTYDCYVDNSQASTSFPYDYFLYAGYNCLGKTRTFIKFDLPELPDNCAVIEKASIGFCQYSADLGDGSDGYLNIYNVTSAWENDRTVTWNAQPTYDSKVIDYCEFKSAAGAEYAFDITKSVKAWYEGAENYGLMLKSADESKTKKTQLYSAENQSDNTYPVIRITYRNNKGLENHWSYSSYSNDTAGAAYINDYTGNLVYELPILSSISEIMPLKLKAYYNGYCANTKFCAGKSGSSKTTSGKGFRLNIQQTVLPSSKYGLKDTAAEDFPYVYTDADGTEHYIKKTTENDSTVYKDEDGLGLTLITASSGSYKYRITDKNGNKWYFNDQGNLFCQKDSNNNEIRVYFKAAASNFSANQVIDYIVDGAGHKFTFDYYTTDGLNNGYIKTITDNAGRVTTFTTSSGLLRKIKYSDNTYTEIHYCCESTNTETDEGLIDYVQGFNGYALNFDYTSKSTGRRVAAVKEYGRNASGTNVKGQTVTFDRTAYNKTVIRSAGADGYHYEEDNEKGADDIITTLQFDNSGRTTSQQLSYGSGGEIGAGSYSYNSGSSTLGSANKVSSSASLGKNSVNLLYNGNAETTSSWSQGASDTVTTAKGNSSVCYMGNKSLSITNTAFSGKGVSYYGQVLNNPTVGNTYTFSSYVRADSLTEIYNTENKGAYIQLTAYNSSNTAIDVKYSERITAKTDTAINNGWRRLTVSITIPANTTSLKAYLCLRDMTGTVYFDCMQLELGSSVNSYNMLENGSFEKHSSNSPTSWENAGDFTVTTNSSGAVIDGSSDVSHKQGSRSLRIDGNALESKGMKQTVAVKPNSKDTYIVSGWANGYAVNDSWHNNNTKFEIAVRVVYTRTKTSDGTTSTVMQYKKSAVFNTTISGWQYSSSAFSLKYTSPESGYTYTPTAIIVIPRYCYQENYAYFDHIQLIKDVAQTYTYDKEGNLISTSSNPEQEVNAKYDDNNDLTSYTDTAGYKSTATYDNNHNLLTTTSAKGIVTSNEYNGNGLITATEIKNSSNTASIKTSKEYYGENTDKGIKANAYTRYVYDENGYKTKYECAWATGIKKKVIYANGAETLYGYDNQAYNEDAVKSRLTSITSEGTVVNYAYVTKSGVASDRISSITYTGTAAGSPSENYSFSYDSYGNVTKTKVGSQALSTDTYAAKNGALTETTYGNGDKRKYNYNNLGLQSSIVTVNDGVSKTSYSWKYNNSGTAMYHRDYENNLKYLYDYDSLGRLIRQELQTNDTSSHVGSTEFSYDVRNNLTKVAFGIDGYTAVDAYLYSKNSGAENAEAYAKDNLISRYKIAGSSTRVVDYKYDGLNRLVEKKLTTNTPVYTKYSYRTSARGDGFKTTQIAAETLDNTQYIYYYDNMGNIEKIKKGNAAYRDYTYDNKNQLLREVNATTGVTYNYSYDCLGNIISKTETTEDGVKTVNYTYGNDGKTGWNNLLTGVDSNGDGTLSAEETISYDQIGNPTSYLGA
ncbi:MAG: DNRLRE domain-containing protein, partial [Acutalibacteraceae bacterium]